MFALIHMVDEDLLALIVDPDRRKLEERACEIAMEDGVFENRAAAESYFSVHDEWISATGGGPCIYLAAATSL
jgi:hypothetical protein